MNKVVIVFLAVLFLCCPTDTFARKQKSAPLIESIPNGAFTANLPCKVVGIHQELKGKSVLFLWLHGGVHDSKKHNFYQYNHFDCCAADDSILQYFEKHNIKAICLFPICHRADLDHCIRWNECFDDVKAIMDDYISKGLIDESRVYIAGSSDGGRGTWDYIEAHPDMFAAAIPMSCSRPRKTTIPVYFYNTTDESDCTKEVEALHQQGYHNIKYKYGSTYLHGDDAAECTDALLTEYFSHTIQKKP